jgi:NitT/TauT family transport system ATP-binding protein
MGTQNGEHDLTEAHAPATSTIIDLQHISMSYAKPSGEPLVVLDDVSCSLRSGEILGLLGRSGSGKSTLLRIAAGLVAPTRGEVFYRGAPLRGPSEGIAVVFQTFALFPWLTVLENVMTSLDALGMPRERARARAASAIEEIGLTGFEGAYPRELSGGMRQRVGFARALVIDPAALFMDEPFSALDVLTAESLRTDFIDVWLGQQCPIDSVLLVTHNIEEAVLLCDRVIVISSKPGRISAEIPIDLRYPRNRFDGNFREIVENIYSILTARTALSLQEMRASGGGVVQPLPNVSPYAIGRVIEKLAGPPIDGRVKLSTIAHPLLPNVDNILIVAEVLPILEFAELADGELALTPAGRIFAASGPEERKRLFKEHVLNFVPLAGHIINVLQERPVHRAPLIRFKSQLEDSLSPDDAETTLRTIISWGRYAGLFGYDDRSQTFTLAPQDDATPELTKSPSRNAGS